MRRIGNVGRGVFGTAVLIALGFGVFGAVATPAAASTAFCTVQTLPQCKADCIAAGARTGTCSAGECECLW